MICAVDTSVVVAALLSWHEHHDRAARALGDLLESSEPLVVPQPVLVESYAVLTRMPAPHRLRPADAHGLLEANLRGRTRIAAVTAQSTWSLLDELAAAEVRGGAAYDALIVRCTVHAGVARIVTFNERDFARIAPESIEIVVP